jgi:poly(A) polymerase
MNTYESVFAEVNRVIDPVFLVGGSVRDLILKREPKDYDFCTPLDPDEVERRIKDSGRKAYGVGKRFGTVGFKVMDANQNWQYVEVTTFRQEEYTEGSRKPKVTYVEDLMEDLSRRDFTMNAIAFDGQVFIDPFAGMLDIELETILPVGLAAHRFREDPLRMLRAARFSSQLGFSISPEVYRAAREQADTILTVSKERWVQELDKLLMGKYAEGMGLGFLRSVDLLTFMIPEISGRDLDDSGDLNSRWLHLFKHSNVIPNWFGEREKMLVNHEIAIGICHRLKFSNERTKFILDGLKADVLQ